MSLSKELSLRRKIRHLEHEALLNVYYTASSMKKKADEFFLKYDLTDVQFNVMMLLEYQSGELGGLTQVELSRMMLVNRANVTSLIDRMEKAKLVKRAPSPDDRRVNVIKLTDAGERKLLKIRAEYDKWVGEIMGVLKGNELKGFMSMLERVRANLNRIEIT